MRRYEYYSRKYAWAQLGNLTSRLTVMIRMLSLAIAEIPPSWALVTQSSACQVRGFMMITTPWVENWGREQSQWHTKLDKGSKGQ